MRDAIRYHLLLPGINDLFDQLTQREFGQTLSGQDRLESKEDMKARGVTSPDLADALALTFARRVMGDFDFDGEAVSVIPYPGSDESIFDREHL
jgi:hypothetical protein